jgi:DNA replication protein DnaC
MTQIHELESPLKRLRLSGILDSLEVRNQQAVTDKWSYIEFLSRLLTDEVERRAAKQLDLRIRRGRIHTGKTLEAFDFGFNPTLNRQQIMDLATCEFIRRHRNCLIVGQTGVGKSHLANALSHEAARKGFDILFTSTHKMLSHIHAGRADDSYERRLASYLKPDLLVIDDFGLKPLPTPSGPTDLYDIINERYEAKSILLTSNRAPSEWPELFDNALLASAALDRLADRAHVVSITGKSYRLTRTADGKEVPLSELDSTVN